MLHRDKLLGLATAELGSGCVGQTHFSPDLTGSISIPQLQPWTSLSICPDMPETTVEERTELGWSRAAALGQSCVMLLRLGKTTDEIAVGTGKQMLANLLVPS